MILNHIAAASLSALSWLSGHWAGAGDGLEVETHYTSPKAGILMGQARFTAGDELAFYEFETFKEEGDAIVLAPLPFGAPGVSFTATEVGEARIVLTNPGNDFPQVIEYKLLPDGRLYSRAEGLENGQRKVIEYTQTKLHD